MSEYEQDEGLECPMCGFTQTEPDKHKENHWFCFLCGVVWNPETEMYDSDYGMWYTWDPEKKGWFDKDGNEHV
jgi:hypothetical protein